ncbi:MAG: hypothetical protein B1H12_03265 [Desulfobacteraceae bacterium 4484_190.2]|nr:MAG: hypothetical protein B1H12_03265 [Desulfobacteraceae bacterium 4484_190.2]
MAAVLFAFPLPDEFRLHLLKRMRFIQSPVYVLEIFFPQLIKQAADMLFSLAKDLFQGLLILHVIC